MASVSPQARVALIIGYFRDELIPQNAAFPQYFHRPGLLLLNANQFAFRRSYEVSDDIGLSGVVLFTSQFASGQGRGENNLSHEVIQELLTQLPRGVILTGKDLPVFVKRAIKPLAKFSSEKLDANTLYGRVLVFTDMD